MNHRSVRHVLLAAGLCGGVALPGAAYAQAPGEYVNGVCGRDAPNPPALCASQNPVRQAQDAAFSAVEQTEASLEGTEQVVSQVVATALLTASDAVSVIPSAANAAGATQAALLTTAQAGIDQATSVVGSAQTAATPYEAVLLGQAAGLMSQASTLVSDLQANPTSASPVVVDTGCNASPSLGDSSPAEATPGRLPSVSRPVEM